MNDGQTSRSDHRWWKALLLALGAAVAAAVAWGSVSPEPEPEPGPNDDGGLATHTGAPAPPTTVASAVIQAVPGAASTKDAPAWVRPTMIWSVLLVLGVVVAVGLIVVLRQIVVWLAFALFFSFALEPAVNYLHARYRWRRGVATILLLALAFIGLAVMILIFALTLLNSVDALLHLLPGWVESAKTWANDTLGVQLAVGDVEGSSASMSQSLAALGAEPMRLVLGVSLSLIGGLFTFFTVGMFIFYMVAEGPQFKRAVLSFFPRAKQEELVSIWEAAIEKTGGYFYSRLLVAAMNAAISYVALRLLGVPGAFALALFQGVIAAFVPIVGTYVGSAVPIIVAFASVGASAGVIYLVYVLVYQQVENFLIAPKLQGRTMALHPAIAFGAALAGGALGGMMWAFLALPFAATVQASASLWFEHHDVMESTFVQQTAPAAAPPSGDDEPGLGTKLGGWARKSRGWLRRGDADTPPPKAEATPEGGSVED